MKVPIVNEKDEVVRYADREEASENGDGEIYCILAPWLTNSKGEILLSQRALTKLHHPGIWSFAVTGRVEGEETYEDTILREAQEELGLNNLQLRAGSKFLSTAEDGFTSFCQYFFAAKDIATKDLMLQKEEVAAVRWISSEMLLKEIETHPGFFIHSPEKWKKWLETQQPF